jgi:hypothetical protein
MTQSQTHVWDWDSILDHDSVQTRVPTKTLTATHHKNQTVSTNAITINLDTSMIY